MKTSPEGPVPSPGAAREAVPILFAWLALTCTVVLNGCAALTNPVADGIQVRDLPQELRGVSRASLVPLPLTSLRQKKPDTYRLAPGDVLGIWIEGVLGEKNQPPPVSISPTGTLDPALGYPIPVRDDGTLPLPLVEPIPVQGLSLKEAEEAIRTAYTVTKKILIPGQERIYVTLMRPRLYHVLVIREEGQGVSAGPTGIYGGSGAFGASPSIIPVGKFGTGHRVDLPAYQNDVLNALAQTGGFPGLDAANEIIVYRDADGQETDPERAAALCKSLLAAKGPRPPLGEGAQVVRIPLRLSPGASPPFRPEDVILKSGDTVFIPARSSDVFYTAGLLGTGFFPLPRDSDLDVLQAVEFVRGPLLTSIGLNNLSGTISQSGLGTPAPSLLTVLRKTQGQGQVTIRVDLNHALRDRRERILVQPGDTLVLQQTLGEALAGYLGSVFHFTENYTVERDDRSNANASFNLP